jgi:hypothetical protein
MTLSRNTVGVLVDMIENKLAMMQIGDREELREVMTLQRCLTELQALAASAPAEKETTTQRGRRRKLADMIDEMSAELQGRQSA